jgi:hypothetical protein
MFALLCLAVSAIAKVTFSAIRLEAAREPKPHFSDRVKM